MVDNMIAKDFQNEELGIVFKAYFDEECCVWFKAKEVAKILGYQNTSKAIQKHVSVAYKKVVPIWDPLGGEQKCIIIKEPGFYELVFKSKLPSAKIFREWVFEKVLPSIRKDGYYCIDRRVMINGEKYYIHPVFSNYAANKNGTVVGTKRKTIRKMSTNNNGYLFFSIRHKQLKNPKMYLQHRFVYEVFKGVIPSCFEIDHINNDKTDNRLENLQLLTHNENIKKKFV